MQSDLKKIIVFNQDNQNKNVIKEINGKTPPPKANHEWNPFEKMVL